MNTTALLTYAHEHLLSTIDRVAPEDWDAPGACGVWSPKEILAHLASFEVVLVELLQSLTYPDIATPTLTALLADHELFNETAVAARRPLTPQAIRQEYETAHQRAMTLLTGLKHINMRQRGFLHWYGKEYDLEDFLICTYYGHKQEHCAQIAAFRQWDRLWGTAVLYT